MCGNECSKCANSDMKKDSRSCLWDSYVVDRLNDNFRFIHLADDLEFARDYSRTLK